MHIQNQIVSRFVKPYHCAECEQYPDTDFYRFRPTNDWIMTFPEQRLFHVHFGGATFPDAQETQQAGLIAQYYYHHIHDYPDHQFFFVIDLTAVDNSGFISDRAKQIYRILLQHPQLATGAVYGATTDMQALIRMISDEVDKPVVLVRTKSEADQAYHTWFQQSLLA